MNMSEFFAAISSEGFGANLHAGQSALFVLMLVLFLASVVLCFQAFRAASSARAAKLDSAEFAKTAEDIVQEMRQLSAQMEKASSRYSGVAASHSEEDGDEFGEPVDLREEDSIDDEASTKNLSVAKEAATVPSSLLTGFFRRR